MKAAARISCARPDTNKELMKISTVLAAAFAAGLTTFAANAREEGARQASMNDRSQAGGAACCRAGSRTTGSRRPAEDVPLRAKKGPTAEEAFHAAQSSTKPESRYKIHHRALCVAQRHPGPARARRHYGREQLQAQFARQGGRGRADADQAGDGEDDGLFRLE